MRFLIFACLFIGCNALGTIRYNELKAICRNNLFFGDNNAGRNVAKVVRLLFHDCVGGCNGCVDMSNPDNMGLGDIYNAVVNLYDNLDAADKAALSRADFIALCGVAGAEQGFFNANPSLQDLPLFNFKTGRQDVDCSNVSPNVFPKAHEGTTETLNFLREEFDFTTNRESVVLMGAHSLGQASLDNSGFSGPWTRQPESLDSDYYMQLIRNWRQTVNQNGNRQWVRNNDRLLMLNADIALFRMIGPVATAQTILGRFNNLRPATTAADVRNLANSPDAFRDEFPAVFIKMSENVPNKEQLQPISFEEAPGQIFEVTQGIQRRPQQGRGGQGGQRDPPPPQRGGQRDPPPPPPRQGGQRDPPPPPRQGGQGGQRDPPPPPPRQGGQGGQRNPPPPPRRGGGQRRGGRRGPPRRS